jgi:hypothetical protein
MTGDKGTRSVNIGRRKQDNWGRKGLSRDASGRQKFPNWSAEKINRWFPGGVAAGGVRSITHLCTSTVNNLHETRI